MKDRKSNVQNLDVQVLDEKAASASIVALEEDSRSFSIKGYGINIQYAREKTTRDAIMSPPTNGLELKSWRKKMGFSQEDLMAELDIRSRQTISSMENSDNSIPRTVQLALVALENHPEVRKRGGRRATSAEKRNFNRSTRDD